MRNKQLLSLDLPDFTGALIKHAPIGIILTDEKTVIKHANPKAAMLCGAPTPASMVGLKMQWTEPDAVPNRAFDLHSIIESGMPASAYTSRTTPFGAQLRCDCTFIPIAENGGNSPGLLILLLDVKEKLQLERNVLEAEKLSALDTIVGGVAHELNNPLTSILGYTELLLSTEHPPEMHRRLAAISEEAERCRHIIENLLSFARRNEAPVLENDINATLREIVKLCAYQMRIENIVLSLRTDDRIPRISIQQRKLQQVFLAILMNAHQALRNVHDRPRILQVSSHFTGESILLKFRDNANGIPKSIRHKIFDPFFTTKPQGEGMGLGLSVAYGVIQEHHGAIHLDTEEGEGTTLTLEFPVPDMA